MTTITIDGQPFDVDETVQQYMALLAYERECNYQSAVQLRNAILQYKLKAETYRMRPTAGTARQYNRAYNIMVAMATGVKQGELFEHDKTK